MFHTLFKIVTIAVLCLFFSTSIAHAVVETPEEALETFCRENVEALQHSVDQDTAAYGPEKRLSDVGVLQAFYSPDWIDRITCFAKKHMAFRDLVSACANELIINANEDVGNFFLLLITESILFTYLTKRLLEVQMHYFHSEAEEWTIADGWREKWEPLSAACQASRAGLQTRDNWLAEEMKEMCEQTVELGSVGPGLTGQKDASRTALMVLLSVIRESYLATDEMKLAIDERIEAVAWFQSQAEGG
ncbi:hypothetical protein FJ365_03465 [Candidatus Dependentiae bacterium]|nr:hypothetical protein [Candidatus Dependentiae bacterium]